jgi:integrase
MAWRVARMARTKSGSVKARKGIPADIRGEYAAIHGRRWEELFRAPPDVSPQTAKALRAKWEAEIETRYATLRAMKRGEGHDLTQKQARALAGEWFRWFVHQHEENPGSRRFIPGSSGNQHVIDDWVEWQWVVLEEIGVVVGGPFEAVDWHAPDARRKWHPIIADWAETDQFLVSRGEVLTPAARDMFLDEVLSEFLTATSLLSRRAGGDYSEDQHVKTFPEYRKAPPQSPRSGAGSRTSGKTAMQLFEGHITANQLADGTVRRWRVVFTTLDAYLAGRDFDALSDDEAQRWVTGLVAEEGRQRGKRQVGKRSAATVMTTYVTALKAVGRWAIKQRLIARNPFAECEVPVPKQTRHRETKAFSADEMRLILSSASAVENTSTPGMAARRWVPWICAYTGARAGEITQLRGKDVIKQEGIDAIRITPEAGTTKTKQAHTVPIHEHLLAQGFLDYVKVKGKGPLFYNPRPPDVTDADLTHPKRPPADIVRGALTRWVRSIGITDPEVGPNHGWRHTFKRIADRCGITGPVSDAITDHAPLTEGRKYGAPTLEDKANALKRFPRYSIDINPDEPKPAQATPNNPKRSRATVGDTNARLHRN